MNLYSTGWISDCCTLGRRPRLFRTLVLSLGRRDWDIVVGGGKRKKGG